MDEIDTEQTAEKSIEELRRDRMWEDYESTYQLLRKFGFIVKYGDVGNDKEMLSKTYTSEELKKILGVGALGLHSFLKKGFAINYWQVFRVVKLADDKYAWEWYDSLGF